MVLLIIVYLLCWLGINGIMYLSNIRTFTSPYIILSQLLCITGFLVLVFLSPQIQSLNEDEEKAKKQDLTNNIFKQQWLDAVANRNRYYILTFLILAFLPFLYILFFVYGSASPAIAPTFQMFDVLLLKLTSSYEGFVILVYTLFSQKPWYFYTVPLFYAFLFTKISNQRTTPTIFKNYLLCLLSILWAFLYFSNKSFLSFVPFAIIIPVLLMT